MVLTLIAGTTKGIGKELCKFLLEKNHNIIRVARNNSDINHKNLTHIKTDKQISHILKDKKIK